MSEVGEGLDSSNIAMNALNIRRKYQRNMQLFMLVKEKNLIDK